MELTWIAVFLCLGGVTGFAAGLFGIGGGGIMVPILALIFVALGVDDGDVMHMALGTSMAAIIPTAVASLRAHNRRNAVHWKAVSALAPGALVGTFAGTFLATWLPSEPLAVFFAVFMSYVAVQMILNRKPQPSRQLPGPWGMTSVGTGIGGISALVAIGGGTMTVPFLTWCNVRLQTAIGTSAAVGLPIACAGAFGYFVNGLPVRGLPEYTVGYIFWPAVLAIAAVSVLTAPLGARLAHKLPVSTLKKLFALLLIGLAIQMLRTVLG
ncbi:sulfite exporter TauE/SafE family protein [Marinimicrobium alkaliphilum]|uniref:sulfite exporter TauE/SafE family protein n=1 Tax=Marinimicrobium alkaliphilum TaxID=2202654 RepID=UPI000DB92280|nr:sulfite exporter TauE/SafE family protein [Marinimicrobium alkaliphilum]